MIYIIRIVSFLVGYLFGNISPGLIIARIKHTNLRELGSGNPGSTNVQRNLGMKLGLLTLFCDIMKAVIPAIICYFVFRGYNAESPALPMLYAGFGAILGHLYPVFLKFKGGKGIATSLGFMIVAVPWTVPVCCVGFLLAVFMFRYISLGSIVAGVLLVISASAFGVLGLLPYEGFNVYEAMIICYIDGALCIFKHRDNIKRLISGNENKFTIKKKD